MRHSCPNAIGLVKEPAIQMTKKNEWEKLIESVDIKKQIRTTPMQISDTFGHKRSLWCLREALGSKAWYMQWKNRKEVTVIHTTIN
jgi:hypothetical protein